MEQEASKLSVWVCREEKLVLGVSKRTTCAAVVKVLLEDRRARCGLSSASLPGCAQPYCIVEKWRGFERILPNKTKILRLWLAWGEERRNVKFVLVKSEASLATHGARSAEARVVPSKQSPCVFRGTARCPAGAVSTEKQRRVVRKAFRKLEKINKKRARAAAHRDASSAERMETLAHLVISQDHSMRQQIQRITELDGDIERCEAEVHVNRMKKHGVNYVQDTYLLDSAAVSVQEGDKLCSEESLAKFEEYVRRREELLRLQEQLWEQEALIDVLTLQIQEELNRRWTQRRQEEPQRRDAEDAAEPGSELLLEGERVRTQLDASLYIGLRLNADLEAIRGDLELSQEICRAREEEMRDLLEKVNSLDIEEAADTEADGHTGETRTLGGQRDAGLHKSHSVNDEDSDTGLSSLHSQDSDSQAVWESLV